MSKKFNFAIALSDSDTGLSNSEGFSIFALIKHIKLSISSINLIGDEPNFEWKIRIKIVLLLYRNIYLVSSRQTLGKEINTWYRNQYMVSFK